MKNNQYYKILSAFLLVVSVIFCFNVNTFASNFFVNIFDNFFHNNNADISLDDNSFNADILNISQKEAFVSMQALINNVKSGDFNSSLYYVNIDNVQSRDVKQIEYYFKNYKNMQDVVKKYFDKFEYVVTNCSTINDEIVFRIKYKCLDLKNIILKIIPLYLIKKFDLKSFDVGIAIECFNNVLKNDDLGMIVYEYDLKMKKYNDIWKLNNIAEIAKDINSSVRSLF